MRYLLLISIFVTGLTLSAQTWHQLLRENGLPATYITAIRSDNSGNVYIGTTVYGVYKYDGSGLTSLTGLLSNNVRAIDCDNSGKVWVGFSSGLSCWNNGIVTNYNTQTGMQSASVYSLAAGGGNIMWIGTGNGLLRYDGTSFLQYTTSTGLPSNMIRALDYDGINLWIGTSSGLSVFNGVSFTTFTTADGLPDNNIKVVHCVSPNEIWAGTDNGAAMFDGTSFTIVNTTSGLLSNAIKGITSDSNGAVWFSTAQALTKMIGTEFTNYSSYNLLPTIDNTYAGITYGIVCSVNNDIYLATSRECYKTRIWTINTMQDTYINTNKVKVKITDYHGIINSDSINVNVGGLEFPTGSGKTTVFNSSLWLGGLDPAQNLLFAGNKWVDSDFFPGPAQGSDNPTNTYDSLYNRIWKISKTEVDNHIQNWDQPGYITPEAIVNWPSLFAEFNDINGNNIYEPDLGETPVIRGDVSVLKIMNDNRYYHATGGNKLKFTTAILYYIYDTLDEALQHTIFVNINVTNNTIFTVSNLYLGIQGDLDVGNWNDDYVGCDSSLSCYYVYNGTSYDNVYGNFVPSQGIVFLSSPLYSFTYYTTSSQLVMSDPMIPEDFYYNLRGFWKDGSPYTYGGNGYGGTTATRYVFSGDPVTGTGWSEISENNTPGDRRVVGAIGPFILDPGKSKCIDFAYVTGLDSNGNYLTSINKMKQNVAEVIQHYNNSSFFCDTIHIDIPTDVDISTNDINACMNEPIELHPSVSGYYWPMTYSWSPSAGLSDTTIVNPIATVSVSTTYYVTITDAHGNTDTDSLTVIVNSPVLNLDSVYNFCEGDRLTLPQYSWYQWSTGSWTGRWYDFYVSGNYWVRARDQYGCWSDTAFFTVNVTPAPQPELGPTITLCNDATTILQPGAFLSFLWSNGSTASSLFVDGNTMTPANYLFSVTVTDATGCTGSDLVVVKVIDCLGNEINDQQEALYAYPNPFNDVIKIVTSENDKGPFTIELLDATGRLVMSRTENVPEIKTSGLRPGFYTLRFSSESGRNVFRLVKTE